MLGEFHTTVPSLRESILRDLRPVDIRVSLLSGHTANSSLNPWEAGREGGKEWGMKERK